MSDPTAPDPMLRLIALFKLAKSLLFISAGFGLLHYLNKDVEAHLLMLVNAMHLDTSNKIIKWLLHETEQLTNVKILLASAVAFFYGILFGIEGTGLYLRKRWAEWFVVIMTGSLLPLEIYEIVHKISVAKVALITGNLIILGYLIWVIMGKKRKEVAGPNPTAPA